MPTNPMMNPTVSALALVALALLAGPASAAVQTGVFSAASAQDQDRKFKAKKAESQVVVTSVQKDFDPSENEFLTIFCGALARVGSSEGLKNVKAKWSAKLLVIDEVAGTVESVDLGSGGFQTDGDGRGRWRATVETADFADGFPERTSVVVQNEVRFTNGKKVNSVDAFCSYP